MKTRSFKIFSGSAHPSFSKEVAKHLNIGLSKAVLGHFSDGEINVQISESVRGRDVCIVQPTCAPVNDNLMELLIMVDALRRSSASSITAVIPYFGYSQTRSQGRPQSAHQRQTGSRFDAKRAD
ncbi:ribose-phosphate pyrophosphokinase [Helicobacter bizzozeronii CIII-1]|uniref:ribose-phosphate diphosphokinase n=1 Tax=Helicobacter bizzozeronii (strain CIII-1) TaxID=1002804 RepID=F8KRF1_HELBC|nr:ribose-phosphate pyrophosphokinase [Helicobacter bizzozeronii CIII-1]